MPAQSALSTVTSLVVTCVVEINGGALKDGVGISSIKVQHDVNRISSAEVSLITLTGKAEDHGFVPGNTITVSAGYSAGAATTIFSGIIVKNTISIDSNSMYKWSVSCRHSAWAMAVTKQNRNFDNVTDSDCINQIIQKNSGVKADVKASTIKHEKLVQSNATDWDFILARADFLGYIICPDGSTLTIAPPALKEGEGVERIALGESIITFNAEINAESQPPTLTATARLGKETNKVTAAEPSFGGKMVKIPSTFLKEPKKMVLDTPMAQDELQTWADGRLLRLRLSAYKGQVNIVGNGGIKTGNWVELAGIGDDYSGLVIVSAVTHTISKGSWKTALKLGLDDSQAHEKANFSSPPAGGQLPAKNGLQRATVTKLEKDPANEYRIQIETQPDTDEGNDKIWARIASNYATASAGSFIMPELNDEVVIGFLENDPRYPIVIGSLYSSTNAAPAEVKDTNFIKLFCSKNKLKLTFDDEKKIITVETPGNNKIVLNDDEKTITITDEHNNSITMAEAGITLDSKKDINLKAQGNISLTSTSGNVSLEASAGNVSVKGNNISETANIEYKASGNASAQVTSSGTTTIKGSIVLIN